MPTTPEDPPKSAGPERRRAVSVRMGLGGLLLAVLLVIAGVALWTSQERAGLEIGGPFSLEDGNGRQVTDRDFRGRYLLVYFGYTFCPDACPTTLNEMAEAIDKLGPKGDRIQPLFITVDPQRDSPAVIKQYVAAFGPKLIGLTGTAEQIAQVARSYRVYYAPHRAGAGANDYTVDHSSVLYLLGPDGRFIAPIGADQPADQMAAEIAKHMS